MNHQQLLMPLVSLFENLRPATMDSPFTLSSVVPAQEEETANLIHCLRFGNEVSHFSLSQIESSFKLQLRLLAVTSQQERTFEIGSMYSFLFQVLMSGTVSLT